MTSLTGKIALLMFASLPALLLTGCGHGAAKPAGEAAADTKALPVVTVAAVTRGTLEQRLPVTGVLQALPGQEASLSPPVAGVLSSLLVRYGQSVTRGQVIAQLSTQPVLGQIEQAQATVGQNRVQVQQAQAGVEQAAAQAQIAVLQAQASQKNAEAALAGAKANLAGTQAALVNAQQNLTRARTLFADGLIPQKDVQAAEAALRTAAAQQSAQQQAVAGQRQTVAGQQAGVTAARVALQSVYRRQDVLVARQQLRNAEGALTTARAQLALYTLHAPLAGQISAVGATAGETVDMTTKIAVVSNLSRMQLNIGLPGSAVASVQRGQMLTFTVGSLPGRVFTARVDSVSQRADPVSGTVPALALVLNPNGLLRSGTTARVQIVTQQRPNVLIVPRAALLSDPDTGKTTVVSVSGDGTAHVVPVKTGLWVGDRIEVQSGVSAGDRVAVTNQYGLPDGAKVRVQK